jgi:hypothetical protein
MKTAMTDLLEWHRKAMRSYSETNKMIEALLEKEKEQIMEAVDKARNTFGDEFDFSYEFTDGEEYYNQTYNQNK